MNMSPSKVRPTGVSVVIPCLNEEKTIGQAVKSALKAIRGLRMSGEVIVADNGSNDESTEIAKKAGARIVEVPIKGYGAALHNGIQAAKYKWVAFADADLSYPFENLPTLIQPLKNGTAEFVLGTRLNGVIEPKAMPFLNRYLGTPVLSFLIRFFFGLPVSDCNSGFRALLTAKYDELNLTCPGMEYASEMLIRVTQHGLKYAEVPIRFCKDQRDRPPHLNRWSDGWRHLRFILGNASKNWLVLGPFTVSCLLFLTAFGLSFQNPGMEMSHLRYHSAFLCVAFALPLLLIALSSLLIQMALHYSHQVETEFTAGIHRFSEGNLPILGALFFFFCMACQTLILFISWKNSGFGQLAEGGLLIRIMISAVIGSFLFMLDIGAGILKLIPFDQAKTSHSKGKLSENKNKVA
jgi:glycosyltransferase involved in cell wall biosynthesis